MARDPFNLGSMPQLQPPAELWPAIAKQLEQDPAASDRLRRTGLWLPAAAIAAGFVIAIAWYWQLPTKLGAWSDPVAVVTTGPEVNNDHISALQLTSQLLQAELASSRSGVIRGHDLAGMALLQSELRLTDALLFEQPDNQQLWQQRNAVLASMTQRYRASDWHTQLQHASY